MHHYGKYNERSASRERSNSKEVHKNNKTEESNGNPLIHNFRDNNSSIMYEAK